MTTSDILIIGGGVVGLAIAVELKLRGASVTVLSRDFRAAASHAAAGMLAPQAEEIPPGAMRDLCLESRSLYPEWVDKLEQLSGVTTGYWACGILAPVYQNHSSTAADDEVAYWLERDAINLYQPGLSVDVVGGWWYPEDGQVDNRALMRSLRTAAESLGIDLQDNITVQAIQQQQRRVIGVQTSVGIYRAEHYVLAAGAWSNELLPVAVSPKKGQMLSLRVPEGNYGLPLQRVLFGSDTYIVPRRDGRIIVGATSEEVGFTPYNTSLGIQTLLQNATRLFSQLQNYPIDELWWGFRPATPDELPILGSSTCHNLTLATGHYRNGILLAPITASLIAEYIWKQKSHPLLEHFHFSRFYQENKFTLALPKSLPSQFLSPSAKMQTIEKPIENSLAEIDTPLTIAGRTFYSRLMTGTGKYRSIEQMQQSVVASGCEIVTVAVRRVQTNAPGHEGLAEALDWSKIWMLPNTAGCQTAEEAIRVARLGREMTKLLGQEDNNFVKLEVIPDAKYLLPDPIGTLEAAEKLVKEGFAVLPYINADPMLAKRLEEVGCVTVMPLASPIGSGQGLKTTANIQIIIENANVPVVVDAGIGTPSEAAQAMELGADALLINTAIAQAKNPPAMARAMSMAAIAGRLAYLAGRIPIKDYASPSSPLSGTITS
ncbi:glycine oxidase ThiO [Gloeocapsopsis dulcis]|uniref:Thiazole synthase n=1 Tax=Gloeocapsopsis dulcis AAB1 = 1H9 TaxID=1433147 RepID=A0A6N8FU20_9CHRO|nr:glycine oxidase ThiO [Gloeocapsopsis dulcis]MUL36620.1 glycine oxidase ThiO [Gloeocapsopsis dulcis AAB1 = 1H9]WNN87244.1 glycine oxidase ThiO [Gloeocapsopsis dulcis]